MEFFEIGKMRTVFNQCFVFIVLGSPLKQYFSAPFHVSMNFFSHTISFVHEIFHDIYNL